jgi:RHS repeat-associated protein
MPNGVVMTYGYDSASRVTRIDYALGSTSFGNLVYSYDTAGRRNSIGGSLARTGLPLPLSSATYNAGNQLTQQGSITLSYDLNGNLISDGTHTYSWNARNQLAALGGGSFSYDAFGRRIQNAASTTFLYDHDNVVQELSGSTVIANSLAGLAVDERFVRSDSSGAKSFMVDALGSTLALSDSTGTTQAQYTYDPFGQTTATGPPSSNSFEFTGRENDGTGLYYYRSRYYNPTLGRFLSEDPARLRGGLNLYEYSDDNPVNLVDPMGLSTSCFVTADTRLADIRLIGTSRLQIRLGVEMWERLEFHIISSSAIGGVTMYAKQRRIM